MNFFVILVFGLISFTNGLLKDDSEYCTYGNTRPICYFRGSTQTLNWAEAHQACNEYNSTLPVIRNEEEGINFQKYWVHLKERKIDISSSWLSGKWVNFTAWTWIDGRIATQNVKNDYGDYFTHALGRLSDKNDPEIYGDLPYLPNYYLCQNVGNCTNGSGIQLTNSCLIESVNRKSWHAARNDCISEGGDLAVLMDQDLEILRNYSQWRTSYPSFWIGLRKGEWFWISRDGEPEEEMKYHNWLDDACSSYDYDGYGFGHRRFYYRRLSYRFLRNICIFYSSSTGAWDTSWCGRNRSVVCQRRGVAAVTPSPESSESHDKDWHNNSLTVVVITACVLLCIAIGVISRLIAQKHNLVTKMELSTDRQYQDIQREYAHTHRELSGYYEEIELRESAYQELQIDEPYTTIGCDADYATVDPQEESTIE